MRSEGKRAERRKEQRHRDNQPGHVRKAATTRMEIPPHIRELAKDLKRSSNETH